MKEINFQLLILALIMFLYVLIIVVLLEIAYFENSLKEVILLLNNMRGV